MARPRIIVDYAIVLRMHDVDGLGWSRMVKEYRKLSGGYISRDTIKRRYYEAKQFQAYIDSLSKLLPAPRVVRAIVIARRVQATPPVIPIARKTIIKRISITTI